MASATTNLPRDLGFALGPVIGSAIAFGIGATVFAGPPAGILGGAPAQPQIQGAAGTSLGQGFQTVYRVAGIVATPSAILILFISARSSAPTPDAIAETTEANEEAAV